MSVADASCECCLMLLQYTNNVSPESVPGLDVSNDTLHRASDLPSALRQPPPPIQRSLARPDPLLLPACVCAWCVQSLVVTSPSAYDAAKGAHAIAILTEWDEFKNLDYDKIYDLMAKPVRPHQRL